MRRYTGTIALALALLLVVPLIVFSIATAASAFRNWRGSQQLFESPINTSNLEHRLLRGSADTRAEALVAMHRLRYRLQPSELQLLLRLACEKQLDELYGQLALKTLHDTMGLHESELITILEDSPACPESRQVQEMVSRLLITFDSSYRGLDRNDDKWIERACELFERRKADGRAW